MFQVDVVIMHSCIAFVAPLLTMIVLIGLTACIRINSCYNVIIRDLGSNDTLKITSLKKGNVLLCLDIHVTTHVLQSSSHITSHGSGCTAACNY